MMNEKERKENVRIKLTFDPESAQSQDSAAYTPLGEDPLPPLATGGEVL